MLYEPYIDRITLQCPKLPPDYDNLNILHLSDLHISRWTRRLELWRQALSTLTPDLVVITGDLGHRAWTWKASAAALGKLLSGLSPPPHPLHAPHSPPPLGMYFILGNHDTPKLIAPLTEKYGLIFLKNQTVFLPPPHSPPPFSHASRVPSAKKRLALIGLDQHRRIDTDIPQALAQVKPDDFKLMLMHYPDLIYQATAAEVDVCLAGHTHGGQICWPDGHPIIRHDVLPQSMCTGVHRFGETWMVVNRGIGTAGFRMRLFCPPHAILLTLVRP